MNHNPPPTVAGLLAAPDKPKELGPYVAVIRSPGRAEIRSRGLPDSDAALSWAYGYMALRGSPSNVGDPKYPNGTTVHIGSRIFILSGRVLRPVGPRRVIAIKAAKVLT